MMNQISSSLGAALAGIVAFLPALLAAVVILALGYVVSRSLGYATKRLLRRMNADGFLRRRVAAERWHRRSVADVLGQTVFWIGMILTAAMAANQLHLHALASGLYRVLAFLPHVFVAALIVGVALYVAGFVGDLVGQAAPSWVARGAKGAILVLAGFMALGELGVATTIVATAFSLLLGAAAVALAIAFGVGNINTAREYTRRWLGRAEHGAGQRTAGAPLETSPASEREPPLQPTEPSEPTRH